MGHRKLYKMLTLHRLLSMHILPTLLQTLLETLLQILQIFQKLLQIFQTLLQILQALFKVLLKLKLFTKLVVKDFLKSCFMKQPAFDFYLKTNFNAFLLSNIIQSLFDSNLSVCTLIDLIHLKTQLS